MKIRTSVRAGLDPQPLPPGARVGLDPQPLPPRYRVGVIVSR